MDYVVFIPGIMGSRLETPEGDEVWPPTVAETKFGYKRKDALRRPDLKVTDIIRKVWCVDIYAPLVAQIEDIGFKENGSGSKRLKLFPYDWRLDLEQTADRLADEIAALAASGATSITLVGHSMGGLIARLVLESAKFSAKPWLAKIDGFLALATPHLGAPLALARILGLDGALGISPADFKEIANDPRYPSAYQLLPAPGEAACWDAGAKTIPPLDIYDAHDAARLGLNMALLSRARFVHETFARGQVPQHVRYFYFAGTGHTTATRVNVSSTLNQVTQTQDAGDGTVPLWSALPRSLQKQVVVGEHSSVFTGKLFSAVFYRLFGASFPTPPIGLAVGASPAVTLSVGSLVIEANDPVDLALLPDTPAGRIEGLLHIERTDDPAQPFLPFGEPAPVAYAGPDVPLLKMLVRPMRQAGHYRLTFEGEPGDSRPIHFAVSQ